MERNGFTKEQIDVAKGVFRTIYRGDLNRKQAIDYLENDFEFKTDKITLEIIDFTKNSDRGLA
jgi:acyl-[acyl carrier protein]--UDP-N-acetylglucosamine O-acyltransferase